MWRVAFHNYASSALNWIVVGHHSVPPWSASTMGTGGSIDEKLLLRQPGGPSKVRGCGLNVGHDEVGQCASFHPVQIIINRRGYVGGETGMTMSLLSAAGCAWDPESPQPA